MNKLTILCLLVVCCSIVAAQRGDYGRRFPSWPPRRPSWPPRRGCRDNRGRRIAPGQSYYDGCNWCRCGRNGQAACTRRACPWNHRPQHRPWHRRD